MFHNNFLIACIIYARGDEINPMKNLEEYQPSEEYIQKCGMDCEIAARIKAIARLNKQLANSQKKVLKDGKKERVSRRKEVFDSIAEWVNVN